VAEVATGFLLQAIEADGPQATLREAVEPVLVARASTGPGRLTPARATACLSHVVGLQELLGHRGSSCLSMATALFMVVIAPWSAAC